MGPTPQWYDEVRSIHDEQFYQPWQQRIQELNRRFMLAGDHVLLTHGRSVPPVWFNGDIERIKRGDWALMVSLNPHIDPNARQAFDWYDSQGFDPQSWWEHWRRFNMEHWYWKFFRPRARLAAGALGEVLPREKEQWFATERMLFIELCPYGSQSFTLSKHAHERLVAADIGFLIAAKVRRLLIEQGRPAVIVVNGNAAVEDFSALAQANVAWDLCTYESVEAVSGRCPGRTLWHRQGYYHAGDGLAIPAIGIPFLRTVHGANWNSEIDQLGDQIRAFLASRR